MDEGFDSIVFFLLPAVPQTNLSESYSLTLGGQKWLDIKADR